MLSNQRSNPNAAFNRGKNLLANRGSGTGKIPHFQVSAPSAPTPGNKPHIGDKDVGNRHTPTAPRPFLTPTQLAKLASLDAGFATRTGTDLRKISDSTYNTNQALATARQGATAKSAQTNDVAAARGLFLSSIRDGDLNDIAATLTMRTNILNTNLSRLITDATGDINNVAANYAITHNLYNQLAVQNAQTVPVSPTPPAPHQQPQQVGPGPSQYTPNKPQTPQFQVTTQPFPPQQVSPGPSQYTPNPRQPRGPRGTPYTARAADAVGGMGGLVKAA